MARLLSQPIPYPSLLPRRPAEVGKADMVASPGNEPSPAADNCGQGWLVTVTDTLGAAVPGVAGSAVSWLAPDGEGWSHWQHDPDGIGGKAVWWRRDWPGAASAALP